MRKFIYFLLLTCISHAIFGQSSFIKGTVRDTIEKKNLPNAVISVLRSSDSVLVRFSRADNQGAFQVGNLAAGDYILMISYPKFADFADKIVVPSSGLDLGMIPLTPRSVLLQEVVVRTNAAIRVKGDTTEFTADSFKVKEGATVEDLLKQIPGMQVNSKGEITAQGKQVDKVLVDGEEFFGADPTIATQNIGAKAVDKVQVFDTKTEQDQLKGIGAAGDGNKTINIKLKESAKKGYFGKVEGATDFDRIANAKLMYNKFRGNKKISFYGTKSNINTGSLGWEDRNKLGIDNDFEYDELSGIYYSYNDGSDEFNDWNLRGIPNAYTLGTLYGNKWNEEKNKLNLSYLYNRLATTNTTTTISQTITGNATYLKNSFAHSTGLSQQHVINGKYEWKIDSLATIKYNVAGTYKQKDNHSANRSYTLNENGDSLNISNGTNDQNSTKKQLDNALTYKQLFHKKDRQLITTLRLGLVNDDQTTQLFSSTDFRKNGVDSFDIVDQLKKYDGHSTTGGIRITYNEPLTKEWNLVTEYSFNANHSVSRRNSFDKDGNQKYTRFNPLVSNNFDMGAFSNSGTLTARYVGKKLRAVLGAGLSAIRLRLDNLDEVKRTNYNFTGFTPQAQLGYRIKPQTGFSVSYRGNTVQPTLAQLQPLQDNSDPLSIRTGNPDLKVGFTHTINGSFNDFKVLKGRYLFGNFSVNILKNAITNQSTFDSTTGKTTYMPVNVNGNSNWFYWSVWVSGQGDKKLIHEIQPQANGGRTINFINGKRNVNNYAYLSLTYSIRYSITDKYNFSVGPMIKRNMSRSSLNTQTNNNYWTYGGHGDGYVMLPGKLELSSDIDVSLQQKTAAFNKAANISVWNAELARKFFKDKSLKISISAHDILNQNIGFNRTINSFQMTEERFDRISRYFLLTASWTFNKMPGKQ